MNEFIGKQNSSVIFAVCCWFLFVYVATYVSQFEKKKTSVFTQLKHCKYSINI